MRRVALSILAAAAALTGAVAAISTPAGADGLVDLSATTVSSPAAVSPPGALVIYTSTFRNEGAVAVEGVFTNSTSGGTILEVNADSTCSTSGSSIACHDTLDPGEAKVVEVVVQSPATAGAVITNSASAKVDPELVQVLDLFPANDTSTVSTTVQESTGVGSAGFVPEGGTLTYKKHVLTVREAQLGVVAFLRDTTAPSTIDCGGVPCGAGLNVDFDQDPRFFGVVEVDVNFGAGDPCRGIGNPACHPLYFRKIATDLTAEPVPACGTEAEGDPCLERTYKVGTEFHFVVVMETNDPDLLPPISIKG